MGELEVWREPFAAIWPEVQSLGEEHFVEVESGIEPKRKFKIDARQLHTLCMGGVLLTITARIDGRLVGYLMWHMMNDLESAGLRIALQGPWFVAPSAPRKTARFLWDRAISELKLSGVECIFPHHRLQGRGAGLGRFFTKRGAKPIQQTYSLWIGE